MVISLADFYGIDPQLFNKTGALDPILGVDTRLFIDPRLLVDTTVPELANSAGKIAAHFDDVIRLLLNVQQEGDPFWRRADRFLSFPEVRGLCIGYSSESTAGRGMGPKKRAKLLDTATRIVQAGVKDPTLFELIGAFEDGIGPDLISDMVAKIIMPDLIAFTQRVCSDLGIPMETQRISAQHTAEDLPKNPETDHPIVLVPRDVLRDLPVAESFSDIFWIAEQNQELRDELNRIIGTSWRKLTTSEQKHGLKESFVANPKTLEDVIAKYVAAQRTRYDFEDDRAGEVQWYRVARELPIKHKLDLNLSPAPTAEEVLAVVAKICDHFARLVEDNQLCRLLYDKYGERKHESAAQLLFFGIAASYCEANDLDLSPESDAGRGPVDFKVSKGFTGKVVVEVKLTSNQQLMHGYETQLPIYQRAEVSPKGIYLVLKNGGISKNRYEAFRARVKDVGDAGPKVMYVDAIPKDSASKAKQVDFTDDEEAS